MSEQPMIVAYGGWCRVCGSVSEAGPRTRGTDNCAWRNRSRMTLCKSCHDDTPQKATVEEFCQVTGLDRNEPGFENWWEDYKYSTYGSVKKYWDSCTF